MDVVKNRVEKTSEATKPGRFMELEGLRVIAAVVVVLYHMWLVFYPATFLGVGSPMAPVQNMRFEDNLFQNPLSALFSGTFAVGIFFVLSGFVLSVGFFKKKKDSNVIIKLASKRYLRLMLPAAASIMIAWVLYRLGVHNLINQTGVVTQSRWLLSQWPIDLSFLAALWEGVIEMFASGQVYYNSALWTINYELVGSFVIFGALLFFGKSPYRWIMYSLLCCFLVGSWLLGFIMGMILADLYVNREGLIQELDRRVAYVLLPIGIVLGGYPIVEAVNPIYKAMMLPGMAFPSQTAFHVTVGATLVVICVLALPGMRKFLARPWLSGLGKYTYSLYLIHMSTLLVLCTSVFLLVRPIGFHKASLIAIGVAFVAVIPLTYLFEKYIDAPSIRFAGFCADVYMGKRKLDLKEKYARARLSLAAKLSLLRRREAEEAMPEIEAE